MKFRRRVLHEPESGFLCSLRFVCSMNESRGIRTEDNYLQSSSGEREII